MRPVLEYDDDVISGVDGYEFSTAQASQGRVSAWTARSGINQKGECLDVSSMLAIRVA